MLLPFRFAGVVIVCCLLPMLALAQLEEDCASVTNGTLANWEADKRQLDRIAPCLIRFSGTTGYVGYYSDAKVSEKKMTAQVEAVLRKFGNSDRIKIVSKYLGVGPHAGFYSQVLPNNFPAPWDRLAEVVGLPVEITITLGDQIGNSYTERQRFVVTVPSDSLVADLMTKVQSEALKQKIQAFRPLYFYLFEPDSTDPLDPKKSVKDYKLSNGSTLRLFKSVRC